MVNGELWNDSFVHRHIGPSEDEQIQMLLALGCNNRQELIEKVTPQNIRRKKNIHLPLKGLTEAQFLKRAREIANTNQIYRSFIGQGYYDTHVPGVILRNILENPAWYTAYTPYQPEISQGRMEALLNFQTMVADLTGLPVANASLLDEGTAAAEAMTMTQALNKKNSSSVFLVSQNVFPQTLEVLQTRAEPLGIKIKIVDLDSPTWDFSEEAFAIYVQYPARSGKVEDLTTFCERAHQKNMLVIFGTDLLALTLLKPPGEMGADIAVGSSQRFGVPMGFGGPHAAFLSTRKEFVRSIPGRIIGVSKDAQGQPALRLSLQTREQHIRREKATSNICTAQVLLAVMSSMYAVYHGPKGLKRIAERTHALAKITADQLEKSGYSIIHPKFFDTFWVRVEPNDKESILQSARKRKINLGDINKEIIALSFDETKSLDDVDEILELFSSLSSSSLAKKTDSRVETIKTHKSKISFKSDFGFIERKSSYLTHPTFNSYHTETEMLRYIRRLEVKDLTLANAMIPLGSCTMKLNSVSEMMPVTWPEFSQIHPFAPIQQAKGYLQMIKELEQWLCELTGFAGISFQPNAGSQGEYAGLLVIRKYHQSRQQGHRDICLIPRSAHGTNPASAVMAGMKVVIVDCDEQGNIDFSDLKEKAQKYQHQLASLMITYPSTHGVFEENIVSICELIHQQGGQVYMDGANFNAMVGLSLLSEIGADVCHLNLHKTFCIPHGGGGPGVGPIGVAQHLQPFLPTHQQQPECGPKTGISAVSAAPWGSAGILPISWAYIQLMGLEGLTMATEVAILSANYIAQRLANDYPVVYKGRNGFVAHECIINCNLFKETANIQVEDIAKRLMDFGFHSPTMSWPVIGTLMIEPTESESLTELNRFCEAMIQIKKEIEAIEKGQADKENNLLLHSPHSLYHLTSQEWNHPYSRQEAAFPLPWVKEHKFWTSVSRVDNAYGDRNLICSCPLPSEYKSNDFT